MEFNTLYQLYSEDRSLLDLTDKLLLIPDYLGYILTGNRVTEITNASTTQMLNLYSPLFDEELLKSVHIGAEMFSPLVEPGFKLGKVSRKWYDQYDLPNTEVVTVATHDTASAVVGIPAYSSDKRWAYISSGTWSLIGCELKTPINSKKAFDRNFTNERGAYGSYRFLKNIMGLWMVQEVQRLYKEREGDLSFSEMAKMASKYPFFTSVVDVENNRFINPENMIVEIKTACQEIEYPIPRVVGEVVNCVYSSLALSYKKELENLQEICGERVDQLFIVGGGSNADALNQLTADLTGIEVYAGPSEATAIGNLIVQMVAAADLSDVEEGRRMVYRSCEIKKYEPREEVLKERRTMNVR